MASTKKKVGVTAEGRIYEKIAIAGAGIGGLAAAIHVHRQGHQVRIFEHVIDPTPVGGYSFATEWTNTISAT